ncbi:MAG: 3-dehydroquinate synthase, partial [Arenibacter algicola]|nr:3-dehydroquinate synthase [Arenibacter algicola]
KKVDCEKKEIDTILTLLKFDKKNSHGNINFVLLKKIGEPAIDIKVTPDLLEQAFAYYAE